MGPRRSSDPPSKSREKERPPVLGSGRWWGALKGMFGPAEIKDFAFSLACRKQSLLNWAKYKFQDGGSRTLLRKLAIWCVSDLVQGFKPTSGSQRDRVAIPPSGLLFSYQLLSLCVQALKLRLQTKACGLTGPELPMKESAHLRLSVVHMSEPCGIPKLINSRPPRNQPR